MWALLHICLLLLIAVPAHARAPAAATGDDHVHLAWPWNTDPIVLVPVLALDLPYVVAIVRLWSRAGAGRGVPVWRAFAYAVGLAALFAALVSPLDAAADASSPCT